ncbi:hypothetical protein GCM10010924_53340 [Rhizobium wenxiniae]|nr:hypothetical protein GCM10010924_53340 [Rhizobium wenxiniae]
MALNTFEPLIPSFFSRKVSLAASYSPATFGSFADWKQVRDGQEIAAGMALD